MVVQETSKTQQPEEFILPAAIEAALPAFCSKQFQFGHYTASYPRGDVGDAVNEWRGLRQAINDAIGRGS